MPLSGGNMIYIYIFKWNRFKGSSLQALGITASTGEFAIIGGTGEFKMARGTIKYNIVLNTPNIESIRELNIQAFYTPETPPAVSAYCSGYIYAHFSLAAATSGFVSDFIC